jgi:hypothetical protein
MNGANHCGAYLEHLQAEHHRLNCALLETRRQFAELNRSTQPQEAFAGLIGHMESLLRELRSHFAEEEQGACLEEAVVRCPSLGAQIKELMGEHSQLARALEQLLAVMKGRAANPDVWQSQFEAFAKELRTHESAENRLLQMALGGDAADYDAEGNE